LSENKHPFFPAWSAKCLYSSAERLTRALRRRTWASGTTGDGAVDVLAALAQGIAIHPQLSRGFGATEGDLGLALRPVEGAAEFAGQGGERSTYHGVILSLFRLPSESASKNAFGAYGPTPSIASTWLLITLELVNVPVAPWR
jgi:hypothetical protein